MSDMEETEGTEGPGVPVAPHRVIGTPPPSPRLLGSTAVAEHREPATAAGEDEEEVVGVPHNVGLPPDDPKMVLHGKRAERVVAACFTLAFFTGCAFIAASTEARPGGLIENAADRFRAWIRGMFTDLAQQAGAPDPVTLGRQLHLLYDGAGLAVRMDHGDAGVAQGTRDAAQALLDAAIGRSHRAES